MKAWKLKIFALLAISICFFLVGMVAMNAVPKYSNAEGTEVQTTIENDDGFYMSKGAQVRIPKDEQEGYDATGIRYTVNLQAQYITQLQSTYQDVTFYSLIAVNGADAVVPETFTGESKTTVIGNVAMLEWAENEYGTLNDGWYTRNITPTNMQKGFDVKLTVRAVAKVVDAENNIDYLYAKLNDNTRTMEAIAYESHVSNANDPLYAGLSKYYGTATPYDGGYAEEKGDSVVSFVDDLTNVELSDSAYACVGASPVEMTNGVVNLDTATADLEVGKTYNVSIYDGDKVYTKPMMYVTQTIDEASDLSIFSLTQDAVENISGYYVVTQDIDATSLTANQHTDSREGEWTYNYAFTGTFDGNGHTIKTNADKGGLFGALNGATITNANFELYLTGSARANMDKWPSGLAYQAYNSKISNVYAQLNVGTGFTTASRTWALALITTTDKTLNMENVVVVNNDDFSKLTPNSANWIGGALFYTDGARGDIASHNANMSNVFVIAPERMNDSGLYVPMAGGANVQVFANNDTVGAADAQTKVGVAQAVYANVTRYNTVSDFVKGLAWENNIPDFIMEDLLVGGTTAYVGETPLQNNAEIKLPLNVAKTVTLNIGAKELINVELSSNDDCVTISGNSFTLTKAGTANVTATGEYKYTTKDNVDKYMTVTFNFTVSLNSTTYEEKVLFSGMDGDVDVKTIFGEGAVLANAFDSDGNVLTVTDGKISGLTNTTNAPIEKTLLLGTSANEWKYVTFTVYTKLIDDAKDLTIFALTKENTANIVGCYLVTKDIDASSEEVIAHTDVTVKDDAYDFDYHFAGVFDGNDKTIEVNVSVGGLFGSLVNATITNANFIFNVTGSMITNTDKYPSGLAYGVSGTQATTTISNVYAELNVADGLTAANSRTWALSLIVSADKSIKLDKVVVVNNDDFVNLTASSAGWVGGALINFHSGRTDNGYRDAHITNVFVIAPERLGKANDGTGNPTANYKYYVPMSGRTPTQAFASNDTAGVEAAKVNTGNTTQYTYAGVTRYSDAKTFVDSNAWSGIISDSVMNAVRLNNVTE